jgi:intermembrane space import and assembly protein 40
MQDCFRAHPDIYGAELEEGEGEDSEGVQDIAPPDHALNPSSDDPDSAPTVSPPIHTESSLTDEVRAKRDEIKIATQKVKEEAVAETEEVVPKESHDTKSDNKEKES